MLKTKMLVLAVICIMGATGLALAEEGHLPLVGGGADRTQGVSDDAYDDTSGDGGDEDANSNDTGDASSGEHPDNHGAHVSSVAKDKEAVGTKILPNGNEVENHGQAVNEAAHDKDDVGATGDNSEVTGSGSNGNGAGNGNARGHD